MVSELKNAVHKIEKLPTKQQREIAKVILDEVAWENSLIKTQHELSVLAEEAILEYKKGKTKRMKL
ncbi:MAG: hypothetical protein K2U26_13975 [Cyclobacteriaceae bacterium]|nr:hypothetical protein [Cyclobacteriaceae bacterium]